jgi:hypothetical protein
LQIEDWRKSDLKVYHYLVFYVLDLIELDLLFIGLIYRCWILLLQQLKDFLFLLNFLKFNINISLVIFTELCFFNQEMHFWSTKYQFIPSFIKFSLRV